MSTMNVPKNLLYTSSHEWAEVTGEAMRVGLTEYAVKQLGDLVFLNLPEVGDQVESEQSFGDVESVKAVADIISPATGEVVAINEDAMNDPSSINADPYGAWLVELGSITAKRELLTPEAYEALLAQEE